MIKYHNKSMYFYNKKKKNINVLVGKVKEIKASVCASQF